MLKIDWRRGTVEKRIEEIIKVDNSGEKDVKELV